MDGRTPTMLGEGELSWSDYQSMGSEGHRSHHVIPRPLGPWMDSVPSSSITASLVSTTSHHIHHNGQISPASTAMDISIPAGAPTSAQNHGYHGVPSSSASSVAPMISHSLSSSVSSMDSWNTMDDYEESAHGDTAHDIVWERDGDDEMLTVPKPEPSDDDFCLRDVQEAPGTPVASGIAPTPVEGKVKRARGRPRKHPLTPVVGPSKVTKGRSKTGCITCRKRKKKCDEAKPRCMNCEKNAVVCEGYPEKQIWRSGKERALAKTQPLPVITLQPIFEGLETTEDMIFWRHYNNQLSAVLTVEGEAKNAFTSVLIPIATRNRGLMHSILALSSKHIDYETPYGANLLKASSSREALQLRAQHHHEKAMVLLRENMIRKEDMVTLMACYSQVLCLFLESLAEGNPRGEHRFHLNAYRALIEHAVPSDAQFSSFIIEFFQFHIFADELLQVPNLILHTNSLPEDVRLAALEKWTPPIEINPPRLLGVADGLFTQLAQITTVRNAVRRNIAAGADPVVGYTDLFRAAEIDAAIREWNPEWPAGDGRVRVALLWKQMMWVYLFQSIVPPQSMSPGNSMVASRESPREVHSQLDHQHQARHIEGMFGLGVLANTPPLSTSPSLASSPPSPPKGGSERRSSHSLGRHPGTEPGFGPLTHSRPYSLSQPQPQDHPPPHWQPPASSMSSAQTHHAPPSRPSSPPPIPLPPSYSPRIAMPISESLTILSSFSPSDPAQRLLLIPCLLIGTACYSPQQQETVRKAVRTVQGHTGLRNAERVGEVLERVWVLMREGRWEKCWDWQGVVGEMGWDFLCA